MCSTDRMCRNNCIGTVRWSRFDLDGVMEEGNPLTPAYDKRRIAFRRTRCWNDNPPVREGAGIPVPDKFSVIGTREMNLSR